MAFSGRVAAEAAVLCADPLCEIIACVPCRLNEAAETALDLEVKYALRWQLSAASTGARATLVHESLLANHREQTSGLGFKCAVAPELLIDNWSAACICWG